MLLHVTLQGCYEAAQDYLINDTVSWFSVLVGVGSTIAILLVSSAKQLYVTILSSLLNIGMQSATDILAVIQLCS